MYYSRCPQGHPLHLVSATVLCNNARTRIHEDGFELDGISTEDEAVACAECSYRGPLQTGAEDGRPDLPHDAACAHRLGGECDCLKDERAPGPGDAPADAPPSPDALDAAEAVVEALVNDLRKWAVVGALAESALDAVLARARASVLAHLDANRDLAAQAQYEIDHDL